jgi:hypothetical protein
LVGFEERLCVVAPILLDSIQMAQEDTSLVAASQKYDPRRKTQLRVPQVRVLQVLLSAQEPMPKSEITRQAGYTALSGTASRALYGVPEGSSSGAAQVGLISLGYVREDRIEGAGGGRAVKHFSITADGKRALD